MTYDYGYCGVCKNCQGATENSAKFCSEKCKQEFEPKRLINKIKRIWKSLMLKLRS